MLTENLSLLLDALPQSVFFDSATRRYRFADTRRFVSREAVLTLQKKYLAEQKEKLVTFAEDARQGKIGTYKDLAETLKRIHVSEAIIAVGGVDKLTPSDLGTIGNILKDQYYRGKSKITGERYGLKYLLQEAPEQSLAQVQNRLRNYAKSGKFTADALIYKRDILAGANQMRRLLGVTEDHCEECIQYAAQNWVAINTLPLPGQECSCFTNCKCSVITRRV